jgi:hypothetical protein
MGAIYMLNNIGMTFPDPRQFGFVPEHGSIPALYTLNECINFFRNCKSKLFVCFLDNQKAFDKIWHDGLFLKLKDLGVTGKLWNILFMSEVLSKVVSSARRIAGIFRSLMLIPLFTAFSSDIKSFM